MNATKPTTATVARDFLAECARLGFMMTRSHGGIVTVTKAITPNDVDSFRDADMDAPLLLAMLGARGGSQWGTDGGSVGGMVAMRTGQFVMNQSGVGARLCATLAEGGAR